MRNKNRQLEKQEIPESRKQGKSIFYCVQAKEMSKWKTYKHLLQQRFPITHIGNGMYKIEIPLWQKEAYPALQKWQEKRVEKKLLEWIKVNKGILVVETSLKTMLQHTKPWQVQENLKLPFLYEILKFCMQLGKANRQSTDIYFVCQAFSKETVEIIKQLATMFKCINIVTEDMVPYTVFANKVYAEDAQLITVSNHKRKALRQAKWIINYDYTTEELQAYTLNREAIVLQIQNKMQTMPIGFCKLVVNDVVLNASPKYQAYLQTLQLDPQAFEIQDILASLLYQKTTRQEKQNLLEELHISIQAVVGMNGIIQAKEFL